MGYRMNKDPFLVWELYHHCFPMAVDKGRVLSIDNPAALRHFAIYGLEGLLLALVSSHQNNGTVVQAVQSAGHQGEGTMGDEGCFIQDNQVVAIQGEVDDGLGM